MRGLFGNFKNFVGKFIPGVAPSKPKVETRDAQLQILLIGDTGVGKTVLANNLVSQAKDFTISQDENSELIRILSSSYVLQHPEDDNIHANITLNIVDISGQSGINEKRLREPYYQTSQLVFLLYNVAQPLTLYNAQHKWQVEINEAVRNVRQDELEKVKLVLVGVNKEAREVLTTAPTIPRRAAQETEIRDWKSSLKKNQNSIKRADSVRVAGGLKYGSSVKQTVIREVNNQPGDLKKFVRECITFHVFEKPMPFEL